MTTVDIKTLNLTPKSCHLIAKFINVTIGNISVVQLFKNSFNPTSMTFIFVAECSNWETGTKFYVLKVLKNRRNRFLKVGSYSITFVNLWDSVEAVIRAHKVVRFFKPHPTKRRRALCKRL